MCLGAWGRERWDDERGLMIGLMLFFFVVMDTCLRIDAQRR